ncbi:hypothetical protein TKK_0013050 [Trichogramma kaykai]
MKKNKLVALLIGAMLLLLQQPDAASAGPVAYAACVAACKAAAMTLLTIFASPAIFACNAAQGTCVSITCAPLLVAPAPIAG